MIRHIIFDMGNVLLRFDRELFLDRVGAEGEDRKGLMREVYLSVEWVMMDRGSLDEPEAELRMCGRLPERLHSAVHELTSRWDQPILPVAGMAELVRELKEKGYGIWLLSNASRRQHEYWPRCPGSELFDGTLISADEGLMKPQKEIYELCLERFGLRAEECFFLDDAPRQHRGSKPLRHRRLRLPRRRGAGEKSPARCGRKHLTKKASQGSPRGELSAKLTEGWKIGYWKRFDISDIF